MKKKQKQNLVRRAWEFVKLQLSGNILFWGGLGGTAFFKEFIGLPSVWALALGNIIAYVVFFLVDKHWVFSDKTGKRKASDEIFRFIIFMSAGYFINIFLVETVSQISSIGIYWSQFFVSTFFFTFFNWLGLRYWVFKPARHAHHLAVTIHTKLYREKRHAKYKQLERRHASKQKAKRTT